MQTVLLKNFNITKTLQWVTCNSLKEITTRISTKSIYKLHISFCIKWAYVRSTGQLEFFGQCLLLALLFCSFLRFQALILPPIINHTLRASLKIQQIYNKSFHPSYLRREQGRFFSLERKREIARERKQIYLLSHCLGREVWRIINHTLRRWSPRESIKMKQYNI